MRNLFFGLSLGFISTVAHGCGVQAQFPCQPASFDPNNPAASGYVVVFADTFADSSTIDMSDTRAAGFHWYKNKFFGWGVEPSGNLTTDAGGLTISTSAWAGQNYNIATASPNGGGYVGSVFSGGMFIESSMAFNGPGINTSNGWPSFWSMAVEHMQGTHNDQWPGQVSGYEHFIEDDFFEYDAPLGNGSRWGAAIHDWSGTSNNFNYYNNGSNTSYNNFLQTLPGAPAITWSASTPHTVGQLWVAGDAANGQQGFIQTYFDGTASVSGAQSSGLRLTEDSHRYRCIRGILAAPPVAFVRVAPLAR